MLCDHSIILIIAQFLGIFFTVFVEYFFAISQKHYVDK